MAESKINHSAIEAYAKAFASTVTSKHFSSKDTINGQEILKVSPVKQVNFLILKNLFESWQEESKKLQSPYFNYKNDQVLKALVTFMNVLSQNIEIKRDDFERLLVGATQDCLYLMFAPFDYFWAELSHDSSAAVAVKSIKGKAKYYKFNKHIIDLYVAKLEAAHGETVSPDNATSIFEEMVKSGELDVDDPQSLVDEFSEVLHLTVDDMYEHVEEVEDPISNLLDAEDELFTLDSSDIGSQQPAYLEKEVQQTSSRESQPAEEDNQRSWFDEQQEEEEEDEPEVIPQPVKFTPEPAPAIVTDERAEVQEEERPLPLKRREYEEEEEPAQDGVLNSKFAKEQKTLNDQLQTGEKVTIADVHQLGKTSKMQESISLNQRYMFINELFNGNSDAYNKAILDIEGCESFDDSVEMMVQRYAKKLDWNMNSPEVKELLKVIFKRFR